MAFIKRSTALIAGLDAQLAALALADSNEVIARQAAISGVESAATAENLLRVAAENAISLTVTTNKALLDTVNGDASTVGSFRNEIANVVNNAPEALNTLKEIADYIAVDPSANVAAAINAAITEIKGTATSAMDTLGEVQTEAAAIRVDFATADTTLEASLKAYADALTARPVLEVLVVANDKVVLSQAPRNGLQGIMNFATVRYTDPDGLSWDVALTIDVTDISGKTFILALPTSGQWNSHGVQVQYLY